MPLSLEQYADHLDTRELAWPAAPEPAAAKARPHLTPLPGVRAVTWSVYGTLLAISGGDLVFEHPTPFIMGVALDKTIQEFNMWNSMTRKAGQPADYLKSIYSEVLRDQSFAASNKNPEVLSEKVWHAILKKLLQKDYKFDASFFGALNEYSQKIAYFFHASLQGTACYAGAADTLRVLAERGIVQGLISDAQCFTVVQLQRGLKQQDASANLDDWVAADARALSCKLGTKKPNENLFRHVLGVLRERGIEPEQVLHVGSRIANDVVPAKRLGMRTALFAGDTASLQATAEQLKTPASRPDILITALPQILDVVPQP